MNLIDRMSKSSVLLGCLHGARTALEKELGLRDLSIATDETIKRTMNAFAVTSDATSEVGTTQGDTKRYPYSFMILSDVQKNTERQAPKMIRRHGYRTGSANATRALTMKACVFPIRLSFNLRYIHDDPMTVMSFIELCLVLTNFGGLTFDVVYSTDNVADDDKFRLGCVLTIPDSLTIPVADTSSTEEPSGIVMDIPLVLECWVGFFVNVAAVNSNSPVLSIDTVITQGLKDVQALAE